MNALRKLLNLTVVVLAINFIGMAVAAMLLAQRADLSREKLSQVKQILFPSEETPAVDEPKPAEPAEPTPMEQLIALLDVQAGKSTEQRVRDVRETFDERAVVLGRARRELVDRQRQIDAATQKLLQERSEFESRRQAFETAVATAADRANDEGFRTTLTLYEQMPAKQTKEIFLQLENQTVLAFLVAMEPRTAAKVLKEFKTDPEIQKITDILELMRQGDPAATSALEELANAAE